VCVKRTTKSNSTRRCQKKKTGVMFSCAADVSGKRRRGILRKKNGRQGGKGEQGAKQFSIRATRYGHPLVHRKKENIPEWKRVVQKRLPRGDCLNYELNGSKKKKGRRRGQSDLTGREKEGGMAPGKEKENGRTGE